MKIVINRCYGVFNISEDAARELKIPAKEAEYLRASPFLIDLIETYGSQVVSGEGAQLKVVEIPDDVDNWKILEEGGWETLEYEKSGQFSLVN